MVIYNAWKQIQDSLGFENGYGKYTRYSVGSHIHICRFAHTATKYKTCLMLIHHLYDSGDSSRGRGETPHYKIINTPYSVFMLDIL